MARALASIWVNLDDLSVLWCINHIKQVPLEHIVWLQSENAFLKSCFEQENGWKVVL